MQKRLQILFVTKSFNHPPLSALGFAVFSAQQQQLLPDHSYRLQLNAMPGHEVFYFTFYIYSHTSSYPLADLGLESSISSNSLAVSVREGPSSVGRTSRETSYAAPDDFASSP